MSKNKKTSYTHTNTKTQRSIKLETIVYKQNISIKKIPKQNKVYKNNIILCWPSTASHEAYKTKQKDNACVCTYRQAYTHRHTHRPHLCVDKLFLGKRPILNCGWYMQCYYIEESWFFPALRAINCKEFLG